MRFASRISCLEDTSMLDAFELIETDDMISFSAGFPSPETYPLDEIKESFIRVMEESGKEALSYCATSGFSKLREIIRDRMETKFGVSYGLEEIIITSGSQQGLDMSGMLFVNKGDIVIFEAPSYLGAVNALRAHEAELVAVPTDREGIIISELVEILNKYGDRVKLIYVNPDFQNPTGRSWSEQRRKDFMECIAHYDVPVIEDGAYAELSFENNLQKPLAYYDKDGQVIYLGTFSKTFCPGLRVAWLCARGSVMEKYLILKNAADLSSSAIAQMQMAYYLSNHDLDEHIKEITELYKKRCETMASEIKRCFPKEVSFVMPRGGLFIWLELPEGLDARELLKKAAEKKVAFVAGTAFYPNASKNNELRLNFSNMNEVDIAKGIRILGDITKEYLREKEMEIGENVL